MAALRGAKVLVVYPPHSAAQRGFQGQMAAGGPWMFLSRVTRGKEAMKQKVRWRVCAGPHVGSTKFRNIVAIRLAENHHSRK